MKLKDIENYIDNIDLKELSMQELEHLTNIIIAIENKKLDDAQREQLNSNLYERV